MPAIVTSLATFPPDDMPIWARLRLITLGVRFEAVTHWQWQTCGQSLITTFTSSHGLVNLNRYA